MQTPEGITRRRGGRPVHLTPGSGRASRTPAMLPASQSNLTPNDDQAEIRANERQRSAQRLRKSLAGAFHGSEPAPQAGEGTAAQAGQGGGASRPLNTGELQALVDACLRLAAENKITERNAWSLRMIDALPDIIRTEETAGPSKFSFQRVSGGLDAGTQIYSKRVDLTYKETYALLQGTRIDEEEEGGGDGEAQEGQAAGPRKRRRGGEVNAIDTLADAASLRCKEGLEAAAGVEPLFHRLCALFDEGGAKGMLLNNLSVYEGSTIMFDSEGVPEQHFPLQPQRQRDSALDLRPIARQLRAARALDGGAGISPAIGGLYQLLHGPGWQGSDASDIAGIMAEALQGLPRRASVPRPGSSQAAAEPQQAGPAPAGAACDPEQAAARVDEEEEEEPAFGPLVEAAAVAAAATEAEAGGGYDSGDEGGGGSDWFGGDDGGNSDGGEEASLQLGGPPRMQQAGAASAGDDGDAPLLSALQQMLEASSGGAALARGSAWAGAGFWRSRSAAQQQAAVKRKAAPAKRVRKAAADHIHWRELLATPLPADAFAEGTARQTCRAAGASKKAARQMLPEDLHIDAASLGRLFLKPLAGLRAPRGLAAGASDARAAAAAGASGQDFGGDDFVEGYKGGFDDDDDDGGGGDYFADPSGDFGGLPGAARPAGAATAWQQEEDEGDMAGDGGLLQAPKRLAPTGVTYSRAAKQVDVAQLKRTIWEGLQSASGQAQAEAALAGLDLRGGGGRGADQAAAAGASIPFGAVMEAVPAVSPAGAARDLSVHMCFICLLHLANEKGLAIRGGEDLTTLDVAHMPAAGA